MALSPILRGASRGKAAPAATMPFSLRPPARSLAVLAPSSSLRHSLCLAPRRSSAASLTSAQRPFSSSPVSAFRSTSAAPAWWSSPKAPTETPPFQPSPFIEDASATASAGDAPHIKASTSASGASVPPSSPPVSDITPPLLPPEASTLAAKLGEAAAHPTTHTFSELTLSWWPNVRAVEVGLNWLHETTHLPWWAVIIGTTVAVRTAVLPLVLKGMANQARLANIQPQIKEHMDALGAARNRKDIAAVQQHAQAVKQLFIDHDCNPARSLLIPLIQAPLFVSFFFALRRLGENGLDTMQAGGFQSMFTDLTVADPTYLAPVASAVTALIVLETGAEFGKQPGQPQPGTMNPSTMKWLLRGAILSMPLFVSSFPVAIFYYWIPNNIFSLCQGFITRSPAVKRAFDIPDPKPVVATVKRTEKAPSFLESVRNGMDLDRDWSAVQSKQSSASPPSEQNGRPDSDQQPKRGRAKPAAGRPVAARKARRFYSTNTAGRASYTNAHSLICTSPARPRFQGLLTSTVCKRNASTKASNEQIQSRYVWLIDPETNQIAPGPPQSLDDLLNDLDRNQYSLVQVGTRVAEVPEQANDNEARSAGDAGAAAGIEQEWWQGERWPVVKRVSTGERKTQPRDKGKAAKAGAGTTSANKMHEITMSWLATPHDLKHKLTPGRKFLVKKGPGNTVKVFIRTNSGRKWASGDQEEKMAVIRKIDEFMVGDVEVDDPSKRALTIVRGPNIEWRGNNTSASIMYNIVKK